MEKKLKEVFGFVLRLVNMMKVNVCVLLAVFVCIGSTKSQVPIEEVKQKCVSYGDYLYKISTQFMGCALNNSRPLNICKNCAQYYFEFSDIYNLMTKV